MDSRRVDIQSLPEDAAALRVLVLATIAERDAAVSERNTLLAQNDRLRHLLLKLTRMQFGAKSERLPEEQMQLGLEALEQAIAKGEAEAEKRDPELRKDNAARQARKAEKRQVFQRQEPRPLPCPRLAPDSASRRLSFVPKQKPRCSQDAPDAHPVTPGVSEGAAEQV